MEDAMGAKHLDQCTWTDIKAEIEGGRTTVVVGFGATEQHGHHLPIGTDAFLGDAVALGVAERLDAFVAPTVRFGCSKHHMAFSGTISMNPETLQAIAADVVTSLAHHGFKEIVLVPTHGGNFHPLDEFMNAFEPIDGVEVIAVTDLDALMGIIARDSGEMGHSPAVAGAHAGEWETSAILHLKPELVHMERAIEGFTGELPDTEGKPFPPLEELHPSGVIGDARPASGDAGEHYVSGWIDLVVGTVIRE
jgi:creatinine amidohydrolase/Fe(II)-dependent formamide hydrolase-like protein